MAEEDLPQTINPRYLEGALLIPWSAANLLVPRAHITTQFKAPGRKIELLMPRNFTIVWFVNAWSSPSLASYVEIRQPLWENEENLRYRKRDYRS